MFRFFRSLISLILLTLLAVGIYLWAERVPFFERYFSKMLNTKVSIESVEISMKRLIIHGLRMNNRSPSKTSAFESQTMTLQVSPFELWNKTIHIDRLEIDNAVLNLELYNGSGGDNNWARLLNGLPSYGSRTFVIRTLIFDNLQFTGVRSNGQPLSISPIPHLKFKNIGEKHPLFLGQMEQVLFQLILTKLTSKPFLDGILGNVVGIPEHLVGSLTSNLPEEEEKGIFQEGLEAIRLKTQEATEFLQALFSSS